MIRLQKDQMVISKADYKVMKANADSWLALQEETAKNKPAPRSSKTSKHTQSKKSFFGDKS